MSGQADFFSHIKDSGMPTFPAPWMAAVDLRTMKVIKMSTAKPLRLLKADKAIELCKGLGLDP